MERISVDTLFEIDKKITELKTKENLSEFENDLRMSNSNSTLKYLWDKYKNNPQFNQFIRELFEKAIQNKDSLDIESMAIFVHGFKKTSIQHFLFTLLNHENE